jgi:DNA-binding GntR family transcriptional regulator
VRGSTPAPDESAAPTTARESSAGGGSLLGGAVSRTVLREQVKEILLERILRGDLAPGDRLVETRIAQELGTSQAPVREALRDLELLHVVVSEPFRGARVKGFDDEDLLNAFPVRAVLEELAAREAAKRLEGDVQALEDEVEAMRVAARAGDMRTQVAHDIAFHRRVVESAANPMLLNAWSALGVEVPTAFGVYHTYFDPMELVEFHVPIVDAIRDRDPTRAAREAKAHVRRTEKVVRKRRTGG